MSRLQWLLSRLRRTLWVRVSLYALLGFAAAIAASLSSWYLPWTLPYDISFDAIDSLLTIIASSMLAVTTFSVSSLTSAYGSATANATPRATALLAEDQFVQSVLATFIGSFLFSIVGLVALKVSFYGPQGRAVLFAVTIGVIVLIVLALLRWIHQLTKLGRVGDTIDRLEDATRRSMQARLDLPFLGGCPAVGNPPGSASHPIPSRKVGYVQFVDAERLSQISEKAGAIIDIRVLPGAFVYDGTPLAALRDAPADDDTPKAICDAFSIGSARSFDQDPRFGVIALTEVALRALSPAMNDPGTAIDVIGRHARLLTLWAKGGDYALRQPLQYPRVHIPALRYDDIYDDAFHLIARDAAGHIDVLIRLIKTLDALRRTGPDHARQAADRQLRLAFDRGLAGLSSDHDRDRLRQVLEGLDRLWQVP